MTETIVKVSDSMRRIVNAYIYLVRWCNYSGAQGPLLRRRARQREHFERRIQKVLH